MKTLLRLDCSAKTEGSISKELSSYFTEKWLEAHPTGTIVHRDLTKIDLPHIKEDTIIGFNTAKEEMTDRLLEVTSLSDELIGELKGANEVLISSPMYNLTIPSSLKAYLDLVVRKDHTFGIDENGYHGHLTDIKGYLITTKGGIMKGTPYEKFDFQDPYLRAILNYIGVSVEKLFSVEGTAHVESVEKIKRTTKKEIVSYFNV